MAGGMGTSCKFDFMVRVFCSKLLDFRAQIAVQSDSLTALSAALMPLSPKVLRNALLAEIALVLEVVLTQHNQGV